MSQFAYRAALFGAALALLGGAALGQSSLPPFNVPLQPPPEDSVVGDVIIEAPKFVERNRMGVITQEMSLSVRVPYNDLDMHTPTGVAELDRRVSAAAAYVCIYGLLVLFAIPAVNPRSTSLFMDAARHGGLLGLLTYGVYNFTCMSIYSDYALDVALRDTLWVGVLFTLVTYATLKLV